MFKKNLVRLFFYALAGLFTAALQFTVVAQQPTLQEQVATFKESLQKSQAQLRRYEWIETTTVSSKGEVKSQKQNRCYYGVDGKIQKVPVGSSPPPSQPSGGRLKRKIVEKKKEELTDYMERAVSLIHHYVPPEPQMIQFARDNNKASYEVSEPNKVIRLDLKDLLKVGDLMSATLDISSNAILNIDVSTYLDDEKDAVKLAVVFKRLPDGTSYSGQTTLDATSKNIRVVVENTGHKLLN